MKNIAKIFVFVKRKQFFVEHLKKVDLLLFILNRFLVIYLKFSKICQSSPIYKKKELHILKITFRFKIMKKKRKQEHVSHFIEHILFLF